MILKIQHHIMLTSYSATMIDKEGSLLPYHSVSCQPHTWGICAYDIVSLSIMLLEPSKALCLKSSSADCKVKMKFNMQLHHFKIPSGFLILSCVSPGTNGMEAWFVYRIY